MRAPGRHNPISRVVIIEQTVNRGGGAIWSVDEIADVAAVVNERTENIGARRLYTIMEILLEDISFEAPTLAGQEVVIDAQYVEDKLCDIIEDEDLSRYIL